MRLSEILDCTVFDTAGAKVGGVNDVRLVQDGPYIEGFGNGLRVEGIVAGPGKVAERLGFHRGGVEGPWMLRVIFRSLEKRGRYIPWQHVAKIEDRVIRLNVAARELGAFVED